MYTKEEIQEELDKQNWEKPELFWQNKKTSDTLHVFIPFRTPNLNVL